MQTAWPACPLAIGDLLELIDVLAPPSEVMQVGKGAPNRVTSTAPYGGGRGDLCRIYQFDRKAAAMVADHLESGTLGFLVLH